MPLAEVCGWERTPEHIVRDRDRLYGEIFTRRWILTRRWYGAGGEGVALSALFNNPMERPMLQSNDLSRSFTALNQDTTLIVVIEMSQSIWLVAGMVPGVERQPLKKLNPDEDQLLKLMNRWRYEALRAGHAIERTVVAYEAGRDGFWLARWLRERGVEAYVIHPSSIAVSREHRRARTDRLDTELLMRAFLGWLRGERRHCSMAAIPTIEEEDAKRPNREHEKLVGDRTRIMNRMKSMLSRLGIRGFKPTLRKADEKLSELRGRIALRVALRPYGAGGLSRSCQPRRSIRSSIQSVVVRTALSSSRTDLFVKSNLPHRSAGLNLSRLSQILNSGWRTALLQINLIHWSKDAKKLIRAYCHPGDAIGARSSRSSLSPTKYVGLP